MTGRVPELLRANPYAYVEVNPKDATKLGIKPNETTEDLRFTLETVNCVGACALGPIVIIDGEYSGQMKTDKVKPLLEGYD